MLDELLCDPCQRLLRGENSLIRQQYGWRFFIHHTTAESLQQALSLDCRICTRLKVEYIRKMRIVNLFVSYVD